MVYWSTRNYFFKPEPFLAIRIDMAAVVLKTIYISRLIQIVPCNLFASSLSNKFLHLSLIHKWFWQKTSAAGFQLLSKIMSF